MSDLQELVKPDVVCAKPATHNPIRIALVSGLAILERHIKDSLDGTKSSIFIERIGGLGSHDPRILESLRYSRLLIIGPDIPFEESISIIRMAKQAAPTIPVLLIHEEDKPEYVKKAARAGARAYILFPFSKDIQKQLESLIYRTSLSSLPVKKLMVRPAIVGQNETVGDVAKYLVNQDISGASVIDSNSNIVGFVSGKDILITYRMRGREVTDLPIAQFMTKILITLKEDSSLDHAIDLFTRHGLHVIPVLRYLKPVGDLLRKDALKTLIVEEHS